MFARVLIANRGEIAVRIVRTCQEMGIETVAVYSDADAQALHVSLADRAVRIGPPPASESYLSTERLIAAAQDTGAEAIHPGYGFLSEQAAFASACEAAHLIFIGPAPEALALMGSKLSARRVAAAAGAPLVPGDTPDDQTDEGVAASAHRVGLPVLIKPSAGGGGIGMKAVRDEASLPDAIAQARREALAAFGDGTLYVERLIERPRHVEVQVLADRDGHVLHVFERECSTQRRHQKVIEEAPSPAVTPALRQRMGDTAVAIARAAGYCNAGTVEFLVEGAGSNAPFYFLEMNARLQVEHPVTEAITGVDLVRAQIAIAAGEPLPWAQDGLALRGHAIELRVYAEDPANHDLPQAGRLLLYREPAMPGIRIDSGVTEGDEISVYYDPLLAKVIASGETREAARRRAIGALRHFPLLGIRTNIPLLLALLEHPRFVAADLDTRFLDMERPALVQRFAAAPPPEVTQIAAAARRAGTHPTGTETAAPDPWLALRNRRF